MRISYISESIIPSRNANAVHVMKMCEAFADLGHDVILHAPRLTEASLGQIADVYAWYGIRDLFPIQRHAVFGGRWRFAAYGWLAASGAARDKPDLVYCRSLLAAYFAIVGRGLPGAFESHAPVFEHSRAKGRLLASMARSHRFRKLVVISEALAQIYRTWDRVPAARIVVAHDAASPAPADLKPRPLPGRPEALKAGYFGHLYPGRGVDIIIDAVRALPNWDLHIVGGTPEDLEDWRSRYTAANCVHFHGHVSPATVAQMRAACDVLLARYQTCVATANSPGGDTSRYMSPLKLFEYMASRRPIVCSDLPVLREVLHDGTAILVPPGDPQAWSAALRQLEDRSARDRLASRAFAAFNSTHTWHARAHHIITAISADPSQAGVERSRSEPPR